MTGSKPYPPSFEAGSVVAKSRGRARERERERKREKRSKRRGIRCWDVRWGRRVASRRTRRHGRYLQGPRLCKRRTPVALTMGTPALKEHGTKIMVNTFGHSFRNLYGEQTSCEGNKIPKPNPKRKEKENQFFFFKNHSYRSINYKWFSFSFSKGPGWMKPGGLGYCWSYPIS